MFALDSFCLHHKLCKRNFLFSKYRKLEFSHLRNFGLIFRLRRHSFADIFAKFCFIQRKFAGVSAKFRENKGRISANFFVISFARYCTSTSTLFSTFLFKEWNEIPLKVRNSESIGSFRNPVLYLLAKF